jgi:radical SAM protein with 4Fe4S-binding SPASM domain
MFSGYPVTQDDFELHLTAEDCMLFYAVRRSGLSRKHIGMQAYRNWNVSRLCAEYLLRCDGKASHREIQQSLSMPFGFMVDRVATFLAEETGVIGFQQEPSSEPSKLFVTGGFDSFAPLHMSVEITDTCNFRCDHCYVSASPMKLGKRDYENTRELFQTLWLNGVKVVELTGGECTTHPDFVKILKDAATTFHLVAIISNGYLLGVRDNLADIVGSFDNVCVQISVDGVQSFHDDFRKKEGSFDALCEAIRRLKRRGVLVRVAMSVTEGNVGQVADVFHLAKELGVDAFSAANITSFGRGRNLGMCSETDHKLYHKVINALAPYADDPLFTSNRLSAEMSKRNKEINCGAGWRTFALNGATGEIRSCLFLADSKKFGSVDRESYGDIFKNKYMAMFKNAPSPSPELETCRSCHYISVCNGCFAKAFGVSESEYPECPWRKKYFPGMQLSMVDPAGGLVTITGATA